MTQLFVYPGGSTGDSTWTCTADDSKASAGDPVPCLHDAHGVLVTMPDDQVTVAIEMPPCT
jgi:hypothetical protein